MDSPEIKKKVQQFRHSFHLQQCNSQTLERIFMEQGFTLIEFNPVINDDDVTTVIHSFGLEEMVTICTFSPARFYFRENQKEC